jgi:hypothetical protein
MKGGSLTLNPLYSMNAIIRGSFIFSCLCVSLAVATPAAVTVASSRELRLAVVDSSKATPARDASHAAFALCLGQAVSRQGGGEIGVKVKCVSADHAAFNLGTGVYDVVLVLSGSLPRALMISDVSRLSATLGSGRSEKKVYMIFSNGDETLSRLLTTSFAQALTDNKFLDAVDGISSRLASAGEGSKVAAATP